jgi:hypothetical protein
MRIVAINVFNDVLALEHTNIAFGIVEEGDLGTSPKRHEFAPGLGIRPEGDLLFLIRDLCSFEMVKDPHAVGTAGIKIELNHGTCTDGIEGLWRIVRH